MATRMAINLPQFPEFVVHAEGSTATRWKKWKDRLENLLVALNITDKKRRKAILLHYAGEEVHDIFPTLTLAQDEEDPYKQALDALDAYFVPKRNKEFDIYKFRQSKQETGETIDTFHTRLRKLAETCAFGNIDYEIKSQNIQSCSSTRLRRRALRESEIDLKQLLLLARSFEISDEQATSIENDTAHVNVMKKTTARKQNHKPNQPNRGQAIITEKDTEATITEGDKE